MKVFVCEKHRHNHASCGGREQEQPQRKGSEAMFFEAPEALPSRGSIPSVHAVDPQIEAARQELIDSQQMPLVHGGATSVLAPSDAVS